MADLLGDNLKAPEVELQTYLDSRLLVSSSKKQIQEITDIVTWVKAFAVYMWISCCSHPSRWWGMTQYKLLIMKTYRQFPGKAWLHYDTAFWKDAPASGLADRSCKNLNLYNFHTCLVPQSQPSAASSPFPNSGSLSSNFCRSRSDSICHWPFGQCRYCHCCDKCEGDRPNINCPFRASKSYEQHSQATTSSWYKCQQH